MSAPAQRRTEAAFVRLLRQRDSVSFELLVRNYGGRVLAVARRFLRNEDDAQDCAQQVFVHVFRAIDDFEESSSLATWLHRITVSEELWKIRRRTRRQEESLDELLSE